MYLMWGVETKSGFRLGLSVSVMKNTFFTLCNIHTVHTVILTDNRMWSLLHPKSRKCLLQRQLCFDGDKVRGNHVRNNDPISQLIK